MTSKKAQAFISRKIRRLKAEGVPEKQRVAIALSLARKRGFKVPRKRRAGPPLFATHAKLR